jgi:single-stranded-DNA-specific exonuclease
MHRGVEKQWRVRDPDPQLVGALVAAVGVSPLVARLLVNRGLDTAAAAQRFLGGTLADLPEPFLLAGMTPAVARLVAAITGGEQICVYGDYDVDGVTATALLLRFLRALRANATYHIPLRQEEGYGLSRAGLEAIAATGARVVISVDCGITAVAEARYCREIGLDLIITDHHLPGSELPEALAVINPQQSGCDFPVKGLAGVGLAFYLAAGLRTRLREVGHFTQMPEPNLREYLDLVALGTIADMVPLREENRLLVRYGLAELSRSTAPGIVALKKAAGIQGDVTCAMVGFRLAPRINAAGRLEDAACGVELLLTDVPATATRLARDLDDGNRVRQELEQEILADVLQQLERLPHLAARRSIVLASASWHPGVIGIVASRVVERYHRPTILIALQDGMGKGSGRSIPGLHLKDALDECAAYLLKFGGHRQAAGLAVAEEMLSAFADRFEAVATGLLTPDDLVPRLHIDAVLEPADLDPERIAELASLAPFGIGNAEPLFLLPGAQVNAIRQLTGGHLRLTLSWRGVAVTALIFSPGDLQIEPGALLDLVGALQINTWQGKQALQLRVKDVRCVGREVTHAA